MLQPGTVAPGTLELLKELCSIQDLKDFYLAGGTALALQIGHRLSVDLDFFGKREFQTDEILNLISAIKPISIISQHKNILILNVSGIKVDFVNYRYPLLEDPIREKGVRVLALSDIAAMKLAAIAGRGRKRDFYDLYFLFKKFSLNEMIGFYNKKYEDGSEMMVARSLVFFDDADTDEPPILLHSDITWNDVKKSILEVVRKGYK